MWRHSSVPAVRRKICRTTSLDQWGLKKAGWRDQQAVLGSRLGIADLADQGDIALYTLSPEGAAEENARVKTEPDVYYFSFTNGTTFRDS